MKGRPVVRVGLRVGGGSEPRAGMTGALVVWPQAKLFFSKLMLLICKTRRLKVDDLEYSTGLKNKITEVTGVHSGKCWEVSISRVKAGSRGGWK